MLRIMHFLATKMNNAFINSLRPKQNGWHFVDSNSKGFSQKQILVMFF